MVIGLALHCTIDTEHCMALFVSSNIYFGRDDCTKFETRTRTGLPVLNW